MAKLRTLGIVSLAVVVPIAAGVVGLLLSSTSAPAATVGTDAQIPPAATQLAAVTALSPFGLYQLPDSGGTLTYADGTNADGNGAPDGVSSVSLFYTLPSGARLQVWQTNNKNLAAEGKDPTTAPGAESVLIGGNKWFSSSVDGDSKHSVLSTRTAAGITISVDAQIPVDQLKSVAASIS